MITTTANDIPGREFQTIGVVRGNVVYCKNIGRDIMAGFKNIAGGEIKSYTDLTNEARDIAHTRMIEEAQQVGGDAIVAMRFASTSIADGTVEMLAYGTAVKLA